MNERDLPEELDIKKEQKIFQKLAAGFIVLGDQLPLRVDGDNLHEVLTDIANSDLDLNPSPFTEHILRTIYKDRLEELQSDPKFIHLNSLSYKQLSQAIHDFFNPE